MGTMMIEVPDDRPVQVIVGDAGFAIPPAPPRLTDERPAPAKRRRPLLTLASGVAVLVVGFIVGQHTITSHAAARPRTASAANPAPPPVQRAFPDHALPSSKPAAASASSAGQVPPALQQQLTRRPTVVPPPGAPPAAAKPAQNPFGLGN